MARDASHRGSGLESNLIFQTSILAGSSYTIFWVCMHYFSWYVRLYSFFYRVCIYMCISIYLLLIYRIICTVTSSIYIYTCTNTLSYSSDKPCLTLHLILPHPPHHHQLFHHRPPTYASYSPNVLPNYIS